MPLFDFSKESSEEYIFSGGKYALRKFDAADEVPDIKLFSEQDIGVMEFQSWALVAEAENLEHYKEEINCLLLSFKIYKLARVFIKYRLCKEDIDCCFRLNDCLHIVMPNESNKVIALNDLDIINEGFSKLLQMEAISNRTHNTIYFMYRGFCADKMIDSFVLLMCSIESLFSDEERFGATKTICSRVSKFLDCKPGYEYKDIKELYDLRSKIVHGKVIAEDEIKGQLNTLYKLQYVLVECMKKMLDEELYLIYHDVENKEDYVRNL